MKKIYKYKKLYDVLIFCIWSLVFIPRVLAFDGITYEDFMDFVGFVTDIMYYLAMGLGVFKLLGSGYNYMMSEGNPKKLTEINADIVGAIGGSLFILLSATIIRLILRVVFAVE